MGADDAEHLLEVTVSAARTRRIPSASPVTVYASTTSGMAVTISRIRSGGTRPSQ